MSNFLFQITANCFEGRPPGDPIYVTFSADLLLISCIASLDLAAYSCRQQDATRRGSSQTQSCKHSLTLPQRYIFWCSFSATSLLPACSGWHVGSSRSCRDLKELCRHVQAADMYKLQELEDSKAATLPGSLDTPKPKAKLPLTSEGPDFHLWVSKHSMQRRLQGSF